MILEVNELTKVYGKNAKANDCISLTLKKGEIFGLLGPNGAGKTTLVNQIIGIIQPTSGMIKINGVDVIKNSAYARERCSFQPQTHVPIEGLNLFQIMEIVGRIRGGKKHAVKERSLELMKKLEIMDWGKHTGEKLSGGIKRLVAFCMAIIVPGDIVILDEPTNDVDPSRRRLLWKQIREVADQGSAVLLVTHNVLEAEKVVDRLAIIDKAKIIKMGTPTSFKKYQNDYIVLETFGDPSALINNMPAFVKDYHVVGSRIRSHIKASELTNTTSWAMKLQQEKKIEEFSIGPITLEDAYLEMTKSEQYNNDIVKNHNEGAN